MTSPASTTVASCHSAPYLAVTASPTSRGSSFFSSSLASSAPSGFSPSTANATTAPRSSKNSRRRAPSFPRMYAFVSFGTSTTESVGSTGPAAGNGQTATSEPDRNDATARRRCSAFRRASSETASPFNFKRTMPESLARTSASNTFSRYFRCLPSSSNKKAASSQPISSRFASGRPWSSEGSSAASSLAFSSSPAPSSF
mmetsp:Transcript_95535/g.275261  ORF Transcript_95535/g.275261 Transcript_95535/m.275261 type:complete len:200 (+) Transcript_95535:3014-3613(+)